MPRYVPPQNTYTTISAAQPRNDGDCHGRDGAGGDEPGRAPGGWPSTVLPGGVVVSITVASLPVGPGRGQRFSCQYPHDSCQGGAGTRRDLGTLAACQGESTCVSSV